MPVDWTPHRFSGGVLALDVANTVVHRDRPEKRFDRFDDAAEIARFAEAAGRLREAEVGPGALRVASPEAIRPRLLALREATDALFRDAAQAGALDAPKLATLLRAAADGISAQPGRGDAPSRPRSLPFEAALGFSALSLLPETAWRRIRICPACAWLFLDSSRNGSRRWCDMAVCGNRSKAQRSYRKLRERNGHA